MGAFYKPHGADWRVPPETWWSFMRWLGLPVPLGQLWWVALSRSQSAEAQVVSAGIWHCSDGEKTHTLTYVLCHRCVTSDLQRKGIDALLRQRYGFVDESPSI
jgi:hypothetical protein